MRHALRTIAFSSALCLGLASGSALFAQDSSAAPAPQDQAGAPMHGHRGPMSPDKELEHLTKNLNLTSDQQSQIKPILEDRQSQMMKIRSDDSIARPDKMNKMKALDEDSNTKLEAVLTDTQKPMYEKMIADRKAKMQAMRAERQGGGMQPQ